MHVYRAAILIFATAIATGCGGGGGGGGGFTNTNAQSIGPAGGTFTISQGALAGTTVTVPAGAVSANTNFTVNPATTQISAPNVTNMGTTVTIGPAGTTFTMPITVTLPFPVSAIDSGMTGENVFVVLQGPSGLVEIIADSVNLSGSITFKTSALGDFVVGKRPLTRKFVITSGAVTNALAGTAITPPITVSYQQENGTVVTTESIPATASLGVNPVTGSTLTGTLTRTPSSGVATFDNLVISQAGSGYRIDFKAPGVRMTSTATFDVTGVPAMLAFVPQPSNVADLTTFTVTVQAQTTGGAVATSFNGQVTLSVGANPNSGALAGNLTVNAASGIATFSVSMNRVGNGYTLVASSGSLTGATSSGFNVTSSASLGDGRLYAINAAGTRLFSVDLRSPNIERTSVNLTGLGAGETIDGIDFRPATGVLYGIASTAGANNRLVTINPSTGAVTQLGGAIPLTGSARGFDFNPVADRIRVVSENGDNLRLNPDTGAVITPVDANLNPGTPRCVASAYTNNFVGAASTTLYQIDSNTDALYIQNPPNNGTLSIVGAGLGVDTSDVAGFDIASVNTAYAALTVSGASQLYKINLAAGTASLVGFLGSENVRGIAVAPVGLVALTSTNVLVTFNSTNPTRLLSYTPVTGLQTGESLIGLDYRPVDNGLNAIGSTSRLYTLNLASGAATMVGAGPFSPALSGTEFGVDFNPTVDRIRVVSDTGQNFRLVPTTAAVVMPVDGNLAYASGDANFGMPVSVVASAYTANATGGIPTMLIGIDSGLDILVSQNPPNAGTLNTIGSLGVNVLSVGGFDIGPDDVAFAALRLSAGSTHQLYTINLATGAATLVNNIDTIPISIRGLTTIVPAGPRMYAVTTANQLINFDPATPATIVAQGAITGLQPGENIVGIDFRPATRELYAVGDTSRLYRINIASRAATQVGAAGAFTLSGTAFGVDFNPVVDRIRITSDADQNLRVNPNDGTLTGTDTALDFAAADPNFGQPRNIVASAYLNNFPGTTTTTLYGIDSGLDILVTQNPPNNGTLNTVGSLGVNPDNNVQFEITPNGTAYAAMTVGGTTGLYTINLATGAATFVGNIGTGTTPLAGMAFGP